VVFQTGDVASVTCPFNQVVSFCDSFNLRRSGGLLADPSSVLVQPGTTVGSRSKLRLGLPFVAAAIVTAAILAGVAVWNLKPSKPQPVMRFYYELPKDQQFSNLTERAFAMEWTIIFSPSRLILTPLR
jgi:hypothetical protein